MAGTSAQRSDDDTSSRVPHLVHTSVTHTRTAPRQARSARSLDLILDAAERLLQVRGVVETSTVDVAAEAGVSVGRLYYWFPDKDAVVQAVLNRAEFRLSALLGDMIIDDDDLPNTDLPNTDLPNTDLPNTDLHGKLLPAIGQFFRQHQGSLAVLQRGPVDGSDPGAQLRRLFVEGVATMVELRVPGIASRERDRVADTVVRIVIAMLAPYVRAEEAHSDPYLDEAAYVVSAYLHGRYAAAHDPVLPKPVEPIRPSPRPRSFTTAARRVHPALASPE